MIHTKSLLADIRSLANPEKAAILQRFFKTGKGQYGEGDVFLGLTMPQTRSLLGKHVKNLELKDVNKFLHDKHHEVRMAGVLTLVYFAKKKIYPLQEIAEFYMRNAGFYEIPPTPLSQGGKICINNWDLIDVSSEHVIGPYIQECLTHEERVNFIGDCVTSPNIWINRIIVLASFHQIKQGNEKLIFFIAPHMLDHKHDLLHKAVGWMLREAGKRCSMDALRGFLDTYAAKMPRTMLRYAIERMDSEERSRYMQMKA